MIDIHNHILPAWDDGPETLAETLKMARQAVAVGTEVMVATPHRSSGGRVSRAVAVRERVAQLNQELQAERIPLEILPGVEIPISSAMVDEVKSGEIGTIADARYLLVEPPFPSLPDFLLPAIANVFSHGYGAVLAHPERNAVVQMQWMLMRNLDFVAACAEMGCVIQLTSGSIVGRFGRNAADVCKAIVKNRNWQIIIASDSHDQKERTPGYLNEARKTVAGWIKDPVAATEMVEDLPRLIIGR